MNSVDAKAQVTRKIGRQTPRRRWPRPTASQHDPAKARTKPSGIVMAGLVQDADHLHLAPRQADFQNRNEFTRPSASPVCGR